MIAKNNVLYSGSDDGVINIWSDKSLLISLIEPTNIQSLHPFKVIDMTIITEHKLLISITNDKRIMFWNYETFELLKTLSVKNDLLCLAVVNSYGKLLIGTKEQTILEIDLAEIMESFSINHNFTQYYFLNDEANYTNQTGKNNIINNFFRAREGR